MPFAHAGSPHHEICAFISSKVEEGAASSQEGCFELASSACGNGNLESGEECDDGRHGRRRRLRCRLPRRVRLAVCTAIALGCGQLSPVRVQPTLRRRHRATRDGRGMRLFLGVLRPEHVPAGRWRTMCGGGVLRRGHVPAQARGGSVRRRHDLQRSGRVRARLAAGPWSLYGERTGGGRRHDSMSGDRATSSASCCARRRRRPPSPRHHHRRPLPILAGRTLPRALRCSRTAPPATAPGLVILWWRGQRALPKWGVCAAAATAAMASSA